jgi:hypothetical protein
MPLDQSYQLAEPNFDSSPYHMERTPPALSHAEFLTRNKEIQEAAAICERDCDSEAGGTRRSNPGY